MAIEIKLPSLGESVDSGDVLSILVSEGDVIAVDQGVLELETDKATMEVPSPQAGRVNKILVAEGETISVGQAILSLEPAEEAVKEAVKEEAKPEPTKKPAKPAAVKEPAEEKKEMARGEEAQRDTEPEPQTKQQAAPAKAPAAEQPQEAKRNGAGKAATIPAPASTQVDTPGDGHASSAAGPAVRRLARELGVDLRRVRATGPGGRITREDVQAHVRESNQKAAQAKGTGPVPPGEPASDTYGAVRREKMSRMRQTIARNMLQSYSTIPQLTNFDDADITELEKIRQESKADYARSGVKLTTMPFLVKAIASALKLHPVVNASVDMETNEVIYKEYVNIGIAVDTERGLVVPVMRDADLMNIPQVARSLATLTEKARSGDYSIEDLRGGTFTISNLGAIGGSYSTPIINPPEVAILLAGRARMVPTLNGDRVIGRLMLPLSLTYDHRVVDGAAAARFLNDVKGYLSAPGRLLLAP